MARRSFLSYLKEQKISSEFWNELKNILAQRLLKPLSHPQFVIYFGVIIVLVGLTGVFVAISSELKKCIFEHENVTLSIATFFVALLASASADLIISVDNEMHRVIKVIGVSSLLLGIGLFWLTVELPNRIAYVPAVLGTMLAFCVWWIANAENPNLTLPPINPNNAVPSTPDNLAGDSGQFNV